MTGRHNVVRVLTLADLSHPGCCLLALMRLLFVVHGCVLCTRVIDGLDFTVRLQWCTSRGKHSPGDVLGLGGAQPCKQWLCLWAVGNDGLQCSQLGQAGRQGLQAEAVAKLELGQGR